MSSKMETAELIGLRVAGLALWLDARGSGPLMAVPDCHAKFLQRQTPEICEISEVSGGLVLRVRNGRLPGTDGWRALVHHLETWELWLDDVGRYVFVAPEICPPRRHVVVDAGFRRGEVIGEFDADARGKPAAYPLENLEIKLFANWLAGCGDLILHAVGIDLAGAGSCFAGSSGVGKSTLAAALANSAATLLGDDQVILRFQDSRFWIYGTPWHQDPARCSPQGVPLEKLFFLDRTIPPGIAPCSPLDGVTRLLQTAFVPYYRPEAVAAILDRLALLAEQVPFYTLGLRLGDNVLKVIGEA